MEIGRTEKVEEEETIANGNLSTGLDALLSREYMATRAVSSTMVATFGRQACFTKVVRKTIFYSRTHGCSYPLEMMRKLVQR